MKHPLALLALCAGLLAPAAHAAVPVSHDHLELELGVIEPERDSGLDWYHLGLSGSWSLNPDWLLLARVTGVAADADGLEFAGSRQTLELGYRLSLSRATDLVLGAGPAAQAIRIGDSEYQYDAGYTASISLRFALGPRLDGGGKLSSTRLDGATATTLRLQASYRLSARLDAGAFFESEKVEGMETELTGVNLRLRF